MEFFQNIHKLHYWLKDLNLWTSLAKKWELPVQFSTNKNWITRKKNFRQKYPKMPKIAVFGQFDK